MIFLYVTFLDILYNTSTAGRNIHRNIRLENTKKIPSRQNYVSILPYIAEDVKNAGFTGLFRKRYVKGRALTDLALYAYIGRVQRADVLYY